MKGILKLRVNVETPDEREKKEERKKVRTKKGKKSLCLVKRKKTKAFRLFKLISCSVQNSY